MSSDKSFENQGKKRRKESPLPNEITGAVQSHGPTGPGWLYNRKPGRGWERAGKHSCGSQRPGGLTPAPARQDRLPSAIPWPPRGIPMESRPSGGLRVPGAAAAALPPLPSGPQRAGLSDVGGEQPRRGKHKGKRPKYEEKADCQGLPAPSQPKGKQLWR